MLEVTRIVRLDEHDVEMNRDDPLEVPRTMTGLAVVLNDQSRPKWDDKEKAALFFGNEVKSSPEQTYLTTT